MTVHCRVATVRGKVYTKKALVFENFMDPVVHLRVVWRCLEQTFTSLNMAEGDWPR